MAIDNSRVSCQKGPTRHASHGRYGPFGRIPWNSVNIVSSNVLLPEKNKRLPDYMLTYHQYFPLHSPRSNSIRSAHELNSQTCVSELYFKIKTKLPSGQCVKKIILLAAYHFRAHATTFHFWPQSVRWFTFLILWRDTYGYSGIYYRLSLSSIQYTYFINN